MKRKFSLFLNIAMLCLSVCAIAFGVYSAQQARLNISGNLGFTAHNAFVSVTGTIKNVAKIENDNVVSKTDIPIDKIVKSADTVDPIDISMPLGDMYFYSSNNNVSAEDMVFELTFTNLGKTDIMATVTKPSLSSTVTVIDNSDGNHGLYISFGSTGEYKLGIYAGASATIQFALHLSDMSALSSKIAFNMPINFEDAFLVHQSNDFFWNNTSDNTRSYVTMGQVSESDPTPLRWYIFAKNKADNSGMEAVSAAVDTNGTLPTGTYWFISEYALDCDTANKKYGIPFDENGSQEYNKSSIQKYLNNVNEDATATAENSFAKKYNFSADNNATYNYLKTNGGRELPTETGVTNVKDTDYTLANQYFWLLSVTELTYLAGEPVSANGTYDSLIAKDATPSHTASVWWLRSPYAQIASFAFRVSSSGNVTDIAVRGGGAVRAAFQITI